MKRIISILLTISTFVIAQDLDMNLQDINPNSSSYNDWIGPSDFGNVVNVYYFGHQY